MIRLLMFTALCLTLLLPTFSVAEPLTVSNDTKAFVNTLAFVKTLARNCDIELQVYGASHLTQPSCENFMSQFQRIVESEEAQRAFADLIRVGEALDPLRDLAFYQQWQRIERQVVEDTDQVQKTFQHIKFQLALLKTSAQKVVKPVKRR